MFRKARTNINGVELPEDFEVGSVINNIAISADRTKFIAVTKSGDLVEGDVPKDGKITVGNTTITYRKGSGSRVNIGRGRGSGISIIGGGVSVSSIGGGSVVMSGSSISIGGNPLEYEIDEIYSLESDWEVVLDSKNEGISLELSPDSQVRVQGLTASEPIHRHGKLLIDGLDGKLWLPKDVDLQLNLKTKNGSIVGDIAHRGVVETKNGAIALNLHASLVVCASTKNGSVDVCGMESKGRGIYAPIGETVKGKLNVSTKNGSVVINYMRK